jgi:hypothetical protein
MKAKMDLKVNFRRQIILKMILIVLLIETVKSTTHWRVTESGRIESTDNSVFTLMRPYDLAAFIKQAKRLQRIDELKQLLASKDIISFRESLSSKSN